MKFRTLMFVTPATLILFLALVPTALASAKWYVDGVNGNDSNDCKSPQTACKTIGHAISLASSGDSILVAAATYKENLTIGFNLKIVGAANATTIIDGRAVNTVVTVSSGNVTLSKVTVTNGLATAGGGIYNNGALTLNDCTVSGNTAAVQGGGGTGGGILNNGTLTINHSTLSGNTAKGVYHHPPQGGAIANYGTTTIDRSTLSGNTADAGIFGGFGGGIASSGTTTIDRSTLSGNRGIFGGGIYDESGSLTINNSTLSGNSGGGVNNANGNPDNINNSTISGNDYGVSSSADTVISSSTMSGNTRFGIAGVSLQNSIVANTTSGPNCYSAPTSNGYNLSSDNSCQFNNTGDLNNTDPKLGALQNNGGPTQTQALRAGSPAIDSGNPGGCTDGQGNLLATDQRGKPRPDKEDTSGCDMGAYERQKD